MFKKILVLLFLISLTTLYACQKDDPTIPEDETVIVLPKEIKSVSGLEDIVVTQHEYFSPLKNVEVINEKNENISYLFDISGHVNYGVVGSYELDYQLTYGDDVITESRTVTVEAGTIQRETYNRTIDGSRVDSGFGSYRIGPASGIAHPINPQNINQDLLKKAVPSNGWWTSLLVSNYGGGNGIYTNPLRSAFSNLGAEVTNPGAGFVQYWNPDGYNTMANFSLALPDMYLKTTTLNEGYQTVVVDYSDSTVNVAMRNVGSPEDHMVLTYAQGSPYIFAEVKDSTKPYIALATQGTSAIEFYQVDGTKITGTSYTGNGIIIKYVQKHIGYETSRPAQVGQPIYGDRYFLVSTPDDSTFGIANNRISLSLLRSNVFSVAAIQNLSEAEVYHDHAYLKPVYGDVSFEIDHVNSLVETTYHSTTQDLKGEETLEPLQFILPHHDVYSDVETLANTFQTVRGFLKLIEHKTFTTSQSFYGLLPAMTKPNNDQFNEIEMTDYLTRLDGHTELSDTENFLNDEGPYWNSKAIYPLAQGIIISNQIGNEDLEVSFISKLRYLLTDWLTYTSESDERYLYYNEKWGSVYYSNNDFNTASELSDHAFTHGYLVYAASVLAMYDDTFVSDYGTVVETLLNDYMYPYKDHEEFDYLRSFDPWAGHTWAHGFGTFAEGNNIESSSEAIQSWVGGYLWALETGNTDLRDAAIYGFVHELASAKMYMFDYEDLVFKDNYETYAGVAGMIWGGKYDYATWFGANPTFIYGIQWLPNGEYLSGYALNDTERTRLEEVYGMYLDSKNQVIDTWFANMWSIQALLDPSVAIAQFDDDLIEEDDYPADLSQTYYLIHGLDTYGRRTTDYTMKIHQHVSSSIYVNESNEVYALVWNPSESIEYITFYGPNDEVIRKRINPNSFEAVKLN